MNGRDLIRQTRNFDRCANGCGVVAAALTGLGTWLFLIQPLDAAIDHQLGLKMEAREILDRRKLIVHKAEKLRTERSDFEVRLKTLLDGIPESAHDSQFLGQVATLARDSELLLEQFRPGKVEKVDEYQQLEIELSASGTHAAICRFLHGLEGLPRMCRVPELHIEANTEEEVFPITLKVLIFFAQDEVETKTDSKAVAST